MRSTTEPRSTLRLSAVICEEKTLVTCGNVRDVSERRLKMLSRESNRPGEDNRSAALE